MAEILQGGKRDYISTSQFAVTNITEDYALDCNANADLATAQELKGAELIIVQDGCKVYRFYDHGFHYFWNCK